MESKFPLIVVTGPTASGKTKLAIDLARAFDGEIICADSRTVYKEMNIGTAKPTTAEMNGIQHHLLDLIYPNEKFTLWNFQHLAKAKIDDIRSRGKMPFLVGGSGLYVDSILFDYQLNEQPADAMMRKELEKLSIEQIQSMLIKQRIKLPENFDNKRYLIRTLEQSGVNDHRRRVPIENAIVVGIATDKSILEQRIRKRAQAMLETGLVEEVEKLLDKYGDQEPLRKNAYGIVAEYLHGGIKTRDEVVAKITTADRQLAKKQMTWFSRNPFMNWLSLDRAYDQISRLIAKQANINFKNAN